MQESLTLETLPLSDWPFAIPRIAYGQGARLQLEVLYSEHHSTPNPTQLRTAWKARQDRRGIPLLVVVLNEGKAHACNPSGEDPTVYPDIDAGQVERSGLCFVKLPTARIRERCSFRLFRLRPSLPTTVHISYGPEGINGMNVFCWASCHRFRSIGMRGDLSKSI